MSLFIGTRNFCLTLALPILLAAFLSFYLRYVLSFHVDIYEDSGMLHLYASV